MIEYESAISVVISAPVKTFFDAHSDGGVTAVSLSPDARYLATLSAATSQVGATGKGGFTNVYLTS